MVRWYVRLELAHAGRAYFLRFRTPQDLYPFR